MQKALGLDPPGRLEGCFHSLFLRAICEATWTETDRDNFLADVVILGLWNRLLKQ